MESNNSRKILIVCRKAPYGNSLSREAIEVALGAAAFDQDLSLAFIGDGIFQLLKEQDSISIELKNQEKLLSALTLYDIDKLFVDKDDLESRSLSAEDLLDNLTLVSTEELKTLFEQQDIILNF